MRLAVGAHGRNDSAPQQEGVQIMTTENQPPIATVFDGNIGIAIWLNTGENGNYYKAQPFRSYKDKDEKWQETDSFSQADLLKLGRLTDKAYDLIVQYREQDKAEIT